MLNTPFSPWPSYSQEEADKAAEVILSNRVNYWTGGECREFEKEFAAWCECDYAVAVTNGTVALDLALKALNIGAGDEVITTSRTFLASASSIVTAGATPVFADVDMDTQNVSADTIKAVLTERTKAVIVVHLAGMPAEMDAIMALAQQHGFYVIEDCAQAHGCRYKGRPVGSIGHIGAWSFCQDKIMTTAGEGGMVTTNDKALWAAMWSYKDHGKSHAAVYEKAHPPGFRWLHESFGTNWRMTEVQGAIGRIQLRRMADWQARRTANAKRLVNTASEFALIRSIPVPDYVTHAWYKCYLFIEPSQLAPGWSRDRIVAAINDAGVPCMQGSCSEVYNEKAFDGTGWRPATPLLNAVQLGETSLMFLVHPTLTEAEMDTSCEVLHRVLAQAQR